MGIPMEIPCFQAQISDLSVPDNFYGTPKPPAEPGALLLNVTDQLLPGARPTSEGKRKRNKSVSNMEKAGIEPPEEEEEERPIVNGNGVVVTPGQSPGGGGREPGDQHLLLWQPALLALNAFPTTR